MTSAPVEANPGLAYQALDYIRDHPEEWDQAYYFCGTVACFASRVLLIDAENKDDERLAYGYRHAACPDLIAAGLLGWNVKDAATVFHNYTRDFSELERLVKNVMNGEVKDEDRLKVGSAAT